MTSGGGYKSAGAGWIAAYKEVDGIPVGAMAPTTTTSTPRATATSIATTSAIPTASLCPAVDTLSVSNYGSAWTIKCNANFAGPGAYKSQGVLNSYLQCTDACDSNAPTGCTAFVYQGGVNGTGSGQCWLMTSGGTYKSAGAGWIAAYKAA
ncbi:hypothetical protein K461DRAFT_271274 [Myriangium duriaei CBS 260.36]|uniref:Apple domain-containing protein n=1 Tax=Myriangium duriaei CBS 260.36 TaxID=1168546 RepID=A0A9P4IUB6_9PEZI|nr:hypothetical protein K461DRAFT_271274 [Myriangium duriaei CBS 260.36]